ncbi:DUF2510 domain-containing protein [Microbacterium trichothecenolyticum]|uniref:DUF2510 domain-containing protein n=1 Tax=Microbacterium trichothecenolyticum TaxID=69370 RepID=UPI0035BE7C03
MYWSHGVGRGSFRGRNTLTDSTPTSAPAGWFPAGVEGQECYWDGTSWTDQVRPLGGIASAVGIGSRV